MGESVIEPMDGIGESVIESVAGCLLGGVYVPRIYRMPGRVIVDDSGLCCCVPVQCVTSHFRAHLLPIVCGIRDR